MTSMLETSHGSWAHCHSTEVKLKEVKVFDYAWRRCGKNLRLLFSLGADFFAFLLLWFNDFVFSNHLSSGLQMFKYVQTELIFFLTSSSQLTSSAEINFQKNFIFQKFVTIIYNKLLYMHRACLFELKFIKRECRNEKDNLQRESFRWTLSKRRKKVKTAHWISNQRPISAERFKKLLWRCWVVGALLISHQTSSI